MKMSRAMIAKMPTMVQMTLFCMTRKGNRNPWPGCGDPQRGLLEALRRSQSRSRAFSTFGAAGMTGWRSP